MSITRLADITLYLLHRLLRRPFPLVSRNLGQLLHRRYLQRLWTHPRPKGLRVHQDPPFPPKNLR